MRESCNHEQLFRRANQNTAAAFNEIWLTNAQQNLASCSRHGKLQEAPADKNKVALVCGSGKSLDLHIDLIHRHRDRLSLFAADTAYTVLTKHGIDPDFTVTTDPAESLKSCFNDMSESTKGSLIAATVTHPAVLANWKGKVYFYNLYDPQTPALMKVVQMFDGVATVESKFNVGELCISMTSTHFCFPHIGFAGIDFAFWRNEYYASGARSSFAPDSSELLVLWNNENQPTVTTKRFAIYMQAFMSNYLKTYGKASCIYNLSKGIIPLDYRLTDFETLLNPQETPNPKVTLT